MDTFQKDVHDFAVDECVLVSGFNVVIFGFKHGAVTWSNMGVLVKPFKVYMFCWL